MPSGKGVLQQIVFESPEGRREALWAETGLQGEYKVLSVPVWCYGVSVGSMVEAELDGNGRLRFSRNVKPSAGGTLRFMVPARGMTGKEVYLSRVVPDAMERGLHIGPATFFQPRLVAFHLRRREDWWPQVGSYLDHLVSLALIEQWEVADPDVYAAEHSAGSLERVDPNRPVLEHQLPVDGSLQQTDTGA